MIKVGSERYEAPECMMQPHLVDVEQPGMAGTSTILRRATFCISSCLCTELLFQTIQAAAVDTRAQRYKHIGLSGGSSMYPGLPSRLEKEMKQLYLTRVLGGDASRLQASHRVQPTRSLLMAMRRTSKSESKTPHAENTWCSWVVPSWPIS